MAVSPESANDLMVVFSNTVAAGFDALQGPVNGVFGLMIVLVVTLTGIQWAMSANREILAAGFGKILLIGFFAYLINDWQGLSETIWAGFVDLGLRAGGSSLSRAEFLNPGAVLQQGWEIVKALGETPAPVDNPLDVMGSMTDALILGLAMIGILLAFAMLALQIIVTLLEFKIVTLGGFVLLPFGIWSHSTFLAERPLGFVISSGLKVLALAIVVSGARSVFDQLQPSANPDLYEALAILCASLLLAMLAIFIPNLASALVNGGPALGAGAAATGALAVGGLGLAAVAGTTGLGAAAARMVDGARSAAGAASGRSPPRAAPPSSPAAGGPATPPRPANGGPSGSRGSTASGAAGTGPQRAEPPPAPSSGSGSTPRPAAAIAAESEDARREFHRAAQPARPPATPRQARSLAARAFFAANTGRAFLPAGETSGALSPPLRIEEP